MDVPKTIGTAHHDLEKQDHRRDEVDRLRDTAASTTLAFERVRCPSGMEWGGAHTFTRCAVAAAASAGEHTV